MFVCPASSVSMAPPKKRALPKPLPEGFTMTDTDKKSWRLGKIIGQGGFGLIYLGMDTHDGVFLAARRLPPDSD